jgi:hypothetical protein
MVVSPEILLTVKQFMNPGRSEMSHNNGYSKGKGLEGVLAGQAMNRFCMLFFSHPLPKNRVTLKGMLTEHF